MELQKTVKLHGPDGELSECPSWMLVKELRVESAGGAPNYGSERVSLQAVIPDGFQFLSLADLQELVRGLQEQCDALLRERIAERNRLWEEKLANQTDASPPGELPERDIYDDLNGTPAPGYENGEADLPKRLNYAPKASDRIPGQWWVVEADKIAYQFLVSQAGNDYVRIAVKYTDGKYTKEDTIVRWGAYWPNGEIRAALGLPETADNKFITPVAPLFLVYQVAEEKTSAGNFAARIVNFASSMAKAAPPGGAPTL